MKPYQERNSFRPLICTLMLCVLPASTWANDPSEAVQRAIDKRFPGAVIRETEQETWKGQRVTEVELTASDGKDYEVLISNTGEILNVEEDHGWRDKLFGRKRGKAAQPTNDTGRTTADETNRARASE
jgi:hypothetical protein